MEGDINVAEESDEGRDEEEDADDEDRSEGEAGLAAEEGDEEQAQDESAGREHAAAGESDGEADESRAPPHDFELVAQMDAVFAGGDTGLSGETTRAVDNAAHTIGERDGERADAGDEDDG